MTTDPASVTTGPAQTRFARIEAAMSLCQQLQCPDDEFGMYVTPSTVPWFIRQLRGYCRAEGIPCDELGADSGPVWERRVGGIDRRFDPLDLVLAVWSSVPLGGAGRGVVAEMVAALKEFCAAENIDWAGALSKSVEISEREAVTTAVREYEDSPIPY